MKIRLSGIKQESIVDGLGLRYVIFAQGCPHHCFACHNPSTHCFTGGDLWEVEDIIEQVFQNPLLKGVTFSGGEPFEQAEAFLSIAKQLKSKEKNQSYHRKEELDIWCYTGYLYEELLESQDIYKRELVNKVDILVDGKFCYQKKTIEKPFVGSSNQRVINIAESQKGHLTELHFFS